MDSLTMLLHKVSLREAVHLRLDNGVSRIKILDELLTHAENLTRTLHQLNKLAVKYEVYYDQTGRYSEVDIADYENWNGPKRIIQVLSEI